MSPTYGFPPEAFESNSLPDFDTEFLPDGHLKSFADALAAPDIGHSNDDLSSPMPRSPDPEREHNPSPDMICGNSMLNSTPAVPASSSFSSDRASQRVEFITAQNDWAPVQAPTRKSADRSKSRRKKTGRTTDETREGYLYSILKWPFLLIVSFWLLALGLGYIATRSYISVYETYIAWRGQRNRLRKAMRATSNYKDWERAAQQLDSYLGNDEWREIDEYAYYDSKTVRHAYHKMKKTRHRAEEAESRIMFDRATKKIRPIDELRALIESCIRNNWVGIESARMYSRLYCGTKKLVENYIDEAEKSLHFLLTTTQLSVEEKRILFKRLNANYGRTALCLSGGAGFAYYHVGVVKALLESDLLPDVITGTSGGALVAALVTTRTNSELTKLLVPALAERITACHDSIFTWIHRWWKTGARFDAVDWANRASWWTRGSMTFKEAFERTGRILNVSCVPADPHSPTILCNYLTSPDCVIWSAVLASAAVPGILNPVVLMMKTGEGTLVPYSFGNKWKDGSLRTDIPIKALNLHFNVNFTIVSQVNPHVNLFFFSSRGTVGEPVTHRKGRGWRGGFLGTAAEQYIKLDLHKWLRVLRHLELLPRPLGQDWSQLWLQEFSGTITIWPRSTWSDFPQILSDPNPARLARMIHEGQQVCFPKIRFISNRLRIERLVHQGRRETKTGLRRGSIHSIISEDDLRSLIHNSLANDIDEDMSDSEITDADAFEDENEESVVSTVEKADSVTTESSSELRGAVNGAIGADDYQVQQGLLEKSN